MCGRREHVRKHGLQKPLEPLQIAVWSTIVVSFILYYTLVVPFLPGDTEFIVSLALHLGIFVVGIFAFFRVSLINPADTGEDLQATRDAHKAEDIRWCNECKQDMAPLTKHCYLCRKCIHRFDHHCLYLNTCVGGHNYKYFFAMVTALTAVLVLQLGFIVYLFIRHNDADYAEKISDSALGGSGAYLGLLGATAIVPFGGLLLISSLWCFHVWIGILRVSTYKWIKDREKKKEDKTTARIRAAQQQLREQQEKAQRETTAAKQHTQSQKQQQQQAVGPQKPNGTSSTTNGSAASTAAGGDVVVVHRGEEQGVEMVSQGAKGAKALVVSTLPSGDRKNSEEMSMDTPRRERSPAAELNTLDDRRAADTPEANKTGLEEVEMLARQHARRNSLSSLMGAVTDASPGEYREDDHLHDDDDDDDDDAAAGAKEGVKQGDQAYDWAVGALAAAGVSDGDKTPDGEDDVTVWV